MVHIQDCLRLASGDPSLLDGRCGLDDLVEHCLQLSKSTMHRPNQAHGFDLPRQQLISSILGPHTGLVHHFMAQLRRTNDREIFISHSPIDLHASDCCGGVKFCKEDLCEGRHVQWHQPTAHRQLSCGRAHSHQRRRACWQYPSRGRSFG